MRGKLFFFRLIGCRRHDQAEKCLPCLLFSLRFSFFFPSGKKIESFYFPSFSPFFFILFFPSLSLPWLAFAPTAAESGTQIAMLVSTFFLFPLSRFIRFGQLSVGMTCGFRRETHEVGFFFFPLSSSSPPHMNEETEYATKMRELGEQRFFFFFSPPPLPSSSAPPVDRTSRRRGGGRNDFSGVSSCLFTEYAPHPPSSNFPSLFSLNQLLLLSPSPPFPLTDFVFGEITCVESSPFFFTLAQYSGLVIFPLAYSSGS